MPDDFPLEQDVFQPRALSDVVHDRLPVRSFDLDLADHSNMEQSIP